MLANPSAVIAEERPTAEGRVRRALQRTPLRVPCRVRVLSDQKPEQVAVGHTVNLSSDGLALHLSRELPEGAPVEIMLTRFRGGPATLVGHVVYSRRVLTGTFEIGVEATGRPASV